MDVDGHWERPFQPVIDLLRKQLGRRPTSGAALCVYRGERPVVDVWGGLRDGSGCPWTRDTTVMSYSTGKGAASTLLHVLVDAGLARYDDPVVAHWPEFAQAGKGDITLRHVLSHGTGLHRLGDWIDDLWAIIDWDAMVERVARARPAFAPGSRSAYQAISYSWLCGGLVERIGGAPFGAQLQERVAEPLGLDGFHIGLPPDQLSRRARQVKPTVPDGRRVRAFASRIGPAVQRLTAGRVRLDDLTAALVLPTSRPFSFDDDRVVQACIPSSNGVFTARALARLYAMWCAGGSLDGVRLLRRETVDEALVVQRHKRDLVVPVHLDWRLGFHSVAGGRARFGHFGYGGRGAFGDRAGGLSFAFLHNDHDGGPGGDRMRRLMDITTRCAAS